MGVSLLLAPDVLLPRSETEMLGRRAIDILSDMAGAPVVIDMCCGSGNLAVGIAHHCPAARIWAADLTDSTVALARRNVLHNSMADRISVRQGDLFSAIARDDLLGKVDMVVCNPPYISSSRLANESAYLLDNEPSVAFDGGPYGISILQRLVREAVDYLRSDGWLLFEFGEGQERLVAALLARTKSYDPPSFAGASGKSRVAVTRRNGRATAPGAGG
ncbi:N5-glutamine methyltransferase family protein [Manganibacter manganicus]|nr:HemK/PrmC family methyltransferase [Pseudaminobacter manganicus]